MRLTQRPPQTSSIFVCFLEELQKQLLEQVELRKKLEREFQNLKGRLSHDSALTGPKPLLACFVSADENLLRDLQSYQINAETWLQGHREKCFAMRKL